MMSDWPYGISTGCFYQTPFLEAIPHVRDGGFTLIEVCSFPKHLDCHDHKQVEAAAKVMEAMGIEALSLHAPFANHIDIASPNATQREESVREVIIACEAAHALAANYIVLHPGPEREGRPTSTDWYDRAHYAADSLNQVAERCYELKISLLLENMLPHLMFGHTSDMLFLLGAIRRTNVGTCLDTGHAFLSGDIKTVVHKLSGHLRMLHANDNNGHGDDHLPPGLGKVDWRPLIRQLRRYQFQGTLILELSGHGTSEEIMSGARIARKYLNEMCREIEVEDAEW
tara:strand:- start:2342 stop:3196 length:855 start_codon:yes stop_codon:yes gene_type:complete